MNEALAFGDRLAYLRWLLSHAGDLGAVMAHVETFRNAGTVADKWAAFKGAGDIVVGWFVDFPEMSTSEVVTAAQFDAQLCELQPQFETAAINWQRLIELLPTIIAIVDTIRKLFAPVPATE